MAIWEQTYRGRGIYWHGKHGYGDETTANFKTIKEAKQAIDRLLSCEQENRPDHLKHWDTVPIEERDRWRRLSIASELSASELAYINAKHYPH